MIELENLTPIEIKRHHLFGLAYTKKQDKTYHDQWKAQFIKNHLVGEELSDISKECQEHSIKVFLLKGYSLMEQVYGDWGARFASDVDCLVKPDQLESFAELLLARGYQRTSDKQWLGNDFKFVFIKKTPLLEYTIEVHTRLFWHCDHEFSEGEASGKYPGFIHLDKESQLLHLCGHLGFQHTFLKLFWLFDINYFLASYGDSINWDRFRNLAEKSELMVSCLATIQALGQWPNTRFLDHSRKRYRMRLWLLRILVSEEFLLHPRAYPLRFLMIKFLLKDRLRSNWKYWWHRYLLKMVGSAS